MALTMTTGDCGKRSRTIATARSIAAASSTEVPPNFITIIPALQSGSFRQVSVRMKKLGVQQGSAGGAADHVVREHGELPIEKIARAEPPDRDRHAGAGVYVKPGLRSIGGIHVDDRLFRRIREMLFLRHPAEIVPRGNDLFRFRLLSKFDRH